MRAVSRLMSAHHLRHCPAPAGGPGKMFRQHGERIAQRLVDLGLGEVPRLGQVRA